MYLIDHYLSVKYQTGGRVFPNLDCWGLVITFFRDELGIDIPLTKSLASQKNSREIETEIMQQSCHQFKMQLLSRRGEACKKPEGIRFHKNITQKNSKVVMMNDSLHS